MAESRVVSELFGLAAGYVAVDVDDEVGFGECEHTDFAAVTDFGEDGVGCDAAADVVDVRGVWSGRATREHGQEPGARR